MPVAAWGNLNQIVESPRTLMQHRAAMPSPVSNSGIRDNHGRGLVGDFLQAKIKPGSRLSVVSAYFTIYAYETLKQHLDQIGHLDFLFGEPRFISSLDPEKTEGEDPNSDLSAY